jgi:hypothetical protein
MNLTLWIVIASLFDRVVDADRIDRGAARLHLALAPMDTRVRNPQTGVPNASRSAAMAAKGCS